MKNPGGLKEILGGIEPIDTEWITKARERTSRLVMPTRALGRLHDMAERMCGISRGLEPSIRRKTVLVMAGDHGVVEEGVSAYPQDVTGAMVKTFLAGGAAINALSRSVNADVRVVDMGILPDIPWEDNRRSSLLFVRKIGRGTHNFTKGPAMSSDAAEQAVLTGFHLASDIFETGCDILGTGDMGIGNTTASAATGVVVTGKAVEAMAGWGTGVDEEGLKRKRQAITEAIEVNKPDRHDGLDILSKVGGFEIGGIAGCALAGAYHKRPVVLDGFVSTAGALVAQVLCPTVTQYLFSGHCSEEKGHRTMLEYLGLEPILDLGMRLGEGTGGVLAMSVMEGALRVFKEVLTFEQAGVAGKK